MRPSFLAFAALAACDVTYTPPVVPAEPSALSPAPTGAAAALATLPVREAGARDGYSRDAFGPRWSDVDRNGCDQRNDVLARDLTQVTVEPGTHDCVVLTGRLRDPYTGATIAFRRGEGTSDDVQIDHVVSLSNAWQTGASGWDEGRREAFANDPLNLLAVDGPTNQSKGDSDAASWLPPREQARCAFAARQVAIKRKHGLWVTPAERDALAAVLQTCPGEPLP